MPVTYQAEFQYKKEKEVFALTRTLPDGTQDTTPLNIDEIHQLEDRTRDFKWNKSPVLSRQIGKYLFSLLNGDRQTLLRALKEADEYGETLQLILKAEGPALSLPFELLHHKDFLVPSRIHLIRRVSDRGSKKTSEPEDRPLKILFMACAPLDTDPVLEFEKEEDTIFEVTKNLPVDIDIEDTGSLEGLAEWLETNEYDVVHITGHADINKEGNPIFWMENDEGLAMPVSPSLLWNQLSLNLPKLIFLSGCRTGEAPEHAAALSFAHHLVSEHVPTVLGWGLPVSDLGASLAAKTLYHDLSRGKNILDAVLRTRYELYNHYPTDWSLLRLFADGSPLHLPIVAKGQEKLLKPRELLYTFLENSQVKVLKRGFIGRRRQIQLGLRCLRKEDKKVGLLLHGTGGLGKSCLAGKFCDRFKDHTLIIVHGDLNAVTFHEALKDAFIRADNDEKGLNILKEQDEMPDKIRGLCSSAFQNRNYLILLDDFEKNIPERGEGILDISPEAVPILEALLKYLPHSGKMTQLIITSRYTFPLTFGSIDLVSERLESIGLTSFRDADERKKVDELNNIARFPDPKIKHQLIETGRGNPRLMEALNTLVGEIKDVSSLLSKAKGKQEEFVQGLVLRQLLESQPEAFQTFLRRSAVYRLPVLKDGIGFISEGLTDWESAAENAVRLSLMEEDSTRNVRYWVSPLLRDDIFAELQAEEQKQCHEVAASYYRDLLGSTDLYDPVSGSELIEHALKSGKEDIAIEKAGGRFLPYLRYSLAYQEALTQGDKILSHIVEPKSDDKHSKFMYELGGIYYAMGDARQAIKLYEQALSIDKELYGERDPSVARYLNSIGLAWNALGEQKKALGYYEQALSIGK
ncbi:MAG TPA: CHAT domain-containing protein, partial [Methanophagales archaeon]|nr:CHAT domain-containing protein [Methanophagales archaeon]